MSGTENDAPLRCWHGGREHIWEPGEACPPERILPPIAVMVSKDEREHIDMLRRQSYELAVERGHIRRG